MSERRSKSSEALMFETGVVSAKELVERARQGDSEAARTILLAVYIEMKNSPDFLSGFPAMREFVLESLIHAPMTGDLNKALGFKPRRRYDSNSRERDEDRLQRLFWIWLASESGSFKAAAEDFVNDGDDSHIRQLRSGKGSRFWQVLVDHTALMVLVRARDLAGEDTSRSLSAGLSLSARGHMESAIQITAERQMALEPIPLSVKDHRRHGGLRPTSARPERVRDCLEAASGQVREWLDSGE